MIEAVSDAAVEDAIWRGDHEFLHEHLPCKCCCSEHTSQDCPARRWSGCRGSAAMPLSSKDVESWADHYARHRHMSREEFFGLAEDRDCRATFTVVATPGDPRPV